MQSWCSIIHKCNFSKKNCFFYVTTNCYFRNEKENNIIPLTAISFLQITSGFEDQWGEQFLPFFIRVHWLRTHLFRKDDNTPLAVQALQLVIK